MGPKRINVGGTKKRECLFCGKISPTYAALELHTNVHTLERPFICTTCGSCYASSSSLWVHQNAAHLGRKYICDICQKECNAQANLIQHRKSHGKIALTKFPQKKVVQKPGNFVGNPGKSITPTSHSTQKRQIPSSPLSKSRIVQVPTKKGERSLISRSRTSTPKVFKRVVVNKWDESFFLHLNRYVPET